MFGLMAVATAYVVTWRLAKGINGAVVGLRSVVRARRENALTPPGAVTETLRRYG